jgi:D-alanine-D-alanine ligase
MPNDDLLKRWFNGLELGLRAVGPELAVFLVYDRPTRVADRPGIDRAHFLDRCVSDEQLAQMIDSLRSIGAYVEVLDGDLEFLTAVGTKGLTSVDRRLKLAYNGIEGGIAFDGFKPGRKALIPAVADALGILCSNSTAHACAIGRHKFQYFTLLQALGIRAPRVWHFRPDLGWAGGVSPEAESRVIIKSTYESWSVGVLSETAIVVDDSFDERVADVAATIGQAVCVQEFVAGPEVCIPVFGVPQMVCSPPVRAILSRAPFDLEAIMTFHDNILGGGVTYERFESSPGVMDRLNNVALNAMQALELSAFGRVDVRIDHEGNPWVIDIGVSPGVSTGSSAFASIASLGFSHAEFVRIVIGASLRSAGLLD